MTKESLLLNKRNNLYEANKNRYDSPRKHESQSKNKNNNLRNDTYESVCAPEDTHERTKLAQRHSMPHNNMSNSSHSHHSGNGRLKRTGSVASVNEMKGTI